MSDIPKVYDPKSIEAKWYPIWLENNCFQAKVDNSKPSFTIMIPPPNVTGVLHMGHILNNTIQDILIRRTRQKGKSALWLPGTDHAGIATQTKVERELRIKKNKSRFEIGREKFTELASEWRNKHGNAILEQLKRLGASCDWSRTVYTLDPDYSHAVLTAFVKLYHKGYIYRGKRMVNWCPVSLTALSDEEVITKTQKGKLYTIRYEIVEKPETYITISTTRPETIMGDTAIAVHPDDERYKSLIGLHVWRPFPRANIPIIADTAVQQEFGSGALKVTPAHDPVDFMIGERHGLSIIDILNPNGTLNALAGAEFNGMDRFKARKVAAQKLKDMSLLVDEKDYENNVGFSERADVPIEPKVSEQWFLRYPRIEEAKKVVSEGLIQFYPERWVKTYLHWLENIQDWCISRQLWWGHRIPVWYKKDANRLDPNNWHVSVEGPSDPQNWEQDSDVLDTWASSWLWPFATLGWPDEKRMNELGFNHFYPTEVLVTGPDIIFFWVARMIVAGLEFLPPEKDHEDKPLSTKDLQSFIPFRHVYFTGIIRDSLGRKMSKSLGNSPEPLDLIEKYGADGLRFGIISIAPHGQDILFSDDRMEQGRNFCNKLWNACRFRQLAGSLDKNASFDTILKRISPTLLDANDHAILNRLVETIENVDRFLDNFEFSATIQELYTFFWNDLCDWYIEVSKSKLQNENIKANCLAIQDLIFRQLLLLLHPFIPFITEELWQGLQFNSNSQEFIQNINPLTAKELLEKLKNHGITLSTKAIEEINNLRELVSKGRSLKAQYALGAKRDVNFFYSLNSAQPDIIENNLEQLKHLIGAASFKKSSAVKDAPPVVTKIGTLYLDLTSSVDLEGEILRIKKELEKTETHIASSKARLNNENFVLKAPENVIRDAKNHLQELETKHQELSRILATLK